MKLPKTWPKELKQGVKIYRVANGDYVQFRLSHYDEAGQRRLQTFSDYATAYAAGQKLTGSIARGDSQAVVLTGAPKLVYLRACDVLRGLDVDLDVAASQFAQASKLLQSASLLEAARAYAKAHPANLPRKTVAEVAQEFIEAKERAGKSDVYLSDCRYRYGRFAEAFHCSIGDVTGELVREFLAGLTNTEGSQKGKRLSARSLNNFKRSIVTLFEFAKTRDYVPKDFDELDSIESADEDDGPIEIYSPDEIAKLLAAASPKYLPALAISAFAGLRSAELLRLDWSEVKLPRGFIEVKASKAKTAARRLVPIAHNLKAWLAPYANQTGKVWSGSKTAFGRAKVETAESAGVPWRHNAPRHSFISYRVAETQDVAKVSLEAGNSPRKIFENYRELVTPEEAKTWFGIQPEQPANVAPMIAAG